jgi:hypothetical protein
MNNIWIIMGTRTDVMIAISKDGWNQLVDMVKTHEHSYDIIDLITGCDRHLEHNTGCHFLLFESVKVYADDFAAFSKLYNSLDTYDYLALYLVEDGSEDTEGNYRNNPFDMYVQRTINFDDSGSKEWNRTFADYTPKKVTSVSTCVDDHTCIACGNAKCSKTEKSCWKCGTPI